MTKRIIGCMTLACVITLVSLLLLGCTGMGTKPLSREEATAEVFKKVAPSVVYAEVSLRIVGPNGEVLQQATPQMSGIIVSSEGHILVPLAFGAQLRERRITVTIERVSVRIEDKDYKGRVIQTDDTLGLSLIKLDAITDVKIAPVSLADSNQVKAGDWLVNIQPTGQNDNFQKLLSSRMVSGKREAEDFTEFVMDATMPVRGTPFITLSSTVAGWVNGMGRIIVSNDLKKTIDNLIALPPSEPGIRPQQPITGTPTAGQEDEQPPYLGMSFGPIRDDYAEALGLPKEGLMISRLYPNSPAGLAGLKKDDVIVEIDGKPLRAGMQAMNDIGRVIRGLKVDQVLSFKIQRIEGSEKTTKIIDCKIGAAPRPKDFIADNIGLTVQEITEPTYYQRNLATKEGVLVVDVKRGGPATATSERFGQALVQPGDIIIELNKLPTRNIDEFTTVADKIRQDNTPVTLVKFWRGNLISHAALNLELGKKEK